ncbi:hypothetical protein HETIRDRAFT_171351 [Heterobasidion irregulare TC 32-1]|uniref:Uncharacterized protein n=1 Tax=Heterobasidion irregulare (strain TC 32-1) TaxID=747525 RepID=W4K540_HETIT|nr:uncharacterized protein HETIRDRAFT_171351 [Heterobasidion irregulare TC 32-1]ETW80161.1 hypothetical protein HETIRDRAFT_171351 [Heterobasidion irregulare TC 32-1]
MILPTLDIIDMFHDRVRLLEASPTSAAEDIMKTYGSQRVFKYRLIPLRDKLTNIIRYNRPVVVEGPYPDIFPAAETEFSAHKYPFDTLPPLYSHVLPHFVIANAVEKLYGMESIPTHVRDAIVDVLGVDGKRAVQIIKDIQRIYGSWVDTKVPVHFAPDMPQPLPTSKPESSTSRPTKRPRTEIGL